MEKVAYIKIYPNNVSFDRHAAILQGGLLPKDNRKIRTTFREQVLFNLMKLLSSNS